MMTLLGIAYGLVVLNTVLHFVDRFRKKEKVSDADRLIMTLLALLSVTVAILGGVIV